MKNDYGLTFIVVVGAFAAFIVAVAVLVLPLIASAGARIQAIGA